MKHRALILLAGLLLLTLTGCQHIYDGYTKKEEEALLSAGRAAVEAYLAREAPGGEISEIYCDTVTDYHKFYLTGYVDVYCKLPGREGSTELMYDSVNGILYSQERVEELTAAGEAYLTQQLPWSGDEILESSVEVDTALPVLYDIPSDRVGGDSMAVASWVPVDTADVAGWLTDPDRVAELTIQGQMTLAEGSALDTVSCGDITGLRMQDMLTLNVQSEEQHLYYSAGGMRADGTGTQDLEDAAPCSVEYYCFGFSPAGEDLSAYHITRYRKERQNAATGQVEREEQDCDIDHLLRVTREADGYSFTVLQPEGNFSFALFAPDGSPALSGEYAYASTYDGEEVDAGPLHWEETEGGAWLCEESGAELWIWADTRLTRT